MNNNYIGVSPPNGSSLASSNRDVMNHKTSLVQLEKEWNLPDLRTFSCRLNGHVNKNRDVNLGCEYCTSKKWDLMYGDEVTSYESTEDMDNPHVDVDVSKSDGDDKEWVAKVMQEADDDQTHEPYADDYQTPEMIAVFGEPVCQDVEYQKVTPSTVFNTKGKVRVSRLVHSGEDVQVTKSIQYTSPVYDEDGTPSTRIVGSVYGSKEVDTYDEDEAKSWMPQNLWSYVMSGLESKTLQECNRNCMGVQPKTIKMLNPRAYNTLLRNQRLVKMFTPESLEHNIVYDTLKNGIEVTNVKTSHVYPVDEVLIGKAVLTNGYKAVETNCWNKAVKDTVRSVIIRIQKTDSESSLIAYYGKDSKHGSPLVSPKSMYQFYQNWKSLSIDKKVSLMESLIPSNIALPMLIPKSGDIVMMWNEDISPHTQYGKGDICHNANVFITPYCEKHMAMGNKVVSAGKMPRQNYMFTLGKGDNAKFINRLSKSNGKTSSGQAYKYESHNLVTIQELQSLSQGENVAWNDETMRESIVYTKRFYQVPHTPMVFKKHRVTIVGTSKIANGEAKAWVVNHVRGILKQYDPSETVLISGGAIGIDRVAEEVAIELGMETEIYMPEEHSYHYYLARDRAMARMSTRVVSIVNPLKSKKCYHCEKSGKDNNHEKSGGCYTGKQWDMMRYEVVVIGKGASTTSSESSNYEERSIVPDNVDFNNIPDNVTVVVGTNNMNWHGRGVAKEAKDAGVIDTEKCYKFVTKYHPEDTLPPYLKPVSLDVFHHNADIFIKYAKANPERTIIMTAVGCGLAGFKPEQVKGFFKDVPSNVQLPSAFK